MLQHVSEQDAEVQQGNAGGKRFLIDYKAWLTRQGKTFRKPPQLYGQDVDLAALYSAVMRRGGFQACCDAGAWRTVAKALQVWGDERALVFKLHVQDTLLKCIYEHVHI